MLRKVLALSPGVKMRGEGGSSEESVISVAGLAVFVHSVRRLIGSDGRTRWGHVAGYAAVAVMCVSVLASLGMALFAADLSAGTVSVIRTFGFITGGVAHVVALGTYVWLTRVGYPARGIHVFGALAAAPAFMSLSSLLFYYGHVFILFGRLLCMAWVVVAAVGLVRADGCCVTLTGVVTRAAACVSVAVLAVRAIASTDPSVV